MKKFLAFVCLVVIILLFPITLLGTVAKYRVFTPTAIKQIVRGSQVAEYLPELIASSMTNRYSTDRTADSIFATTESNKAIKKILPPEDVYVITDQVVDALAIWFNTTKPVEELDLKIDLTQIKQNLIPALDEELKGQLKDFPVCDDSLTASDFKSLDTNQVTALQDIDCLPVNFDKESLIHETGQTVHTSLLQDIPDELTTDTIITKQLANSTVSAYTLNSTANQLRHAWRWFNFGLWVAWIIIVLCLFTMMMLRLHPLHAAFTWLSWTHLFITLELIPLSLVMWFAPDWLLPWLSSSTNAVAVTVLNGALRQLIKLCTWPIVWTMIGTAAATLLYTIIHFILKYHSDSKSTRLANPSPSPQ